MSLESQLRGLVHAGIAFVVVGGVAAVVHGSARVTNDLDVCYDTDPGNVRALVSLLAAWHAYPRGWPEGLSFVLDERTFRTTPLMTLQTSEGELDLLDRLAGVGDYAAALEQSVEVSVFGVTVRVLALDALIEAKRATGRSKDQQHLPELEALLALRARRPD